MNTSISKYIKKPMVLAVFSGTCLMLYGTGISAQYGNQPASVGNDTVEAQNTHSTYEFRSVDKNNNNELSWSEISKVYDKELEKLGWKKGQVMKTYDTDDDGVLDTLEYRKFMQGVVTKSDITITNNESASVGANTSSTPPTQDSSSKGISDRAHAAVQPRSAPIGAPPTMDNIAPNEVKALKGREVINLADERIGTVKEVIQRKDGDIEGLVIDVGETANGKREVFVPSKEVQLANQRIVWQSHKTKKDAQQMPEYNPARFSGV